MDFHGVPTYAISRCGGYEEFNRTSNPGWSKIKVLSKSINFSTLSVVSPLRTLLVRWRGNLTPTTLLNVTLVHKIGLR